MTWQFCMINVSVEKKQAAQLSQRNRAAGIVVSFGWNTSGMRPLAVPVINALVLSSLRECRQCWHSIKWFQGRSTNETTLMRCHCHFGKVKSSYCSSTDTGAAATLRYALHPTDDGYHIIIIVIYIPKTHTTQRARRANSMWQVRQGWNTALTVAIEKKCLNAVSEEKSTKINTWAIIQTCLLHNDFIYGNPRS